MSRSRCRFLTRIACWVGALCLAAAILLPVDRVVNAVLTPGVTAYLQGKRGLEAVAAYRGLVREACGWLRIALATWGLYVMSTPLWGRSLLSGPREAGPRLDRTVSWGRADIRVAVPLAVAAILGWRIMQGAFMVDEIGPFLSNTLRGPVITAAHIVSSPTRTHTAYALAQWVSYRLLGENEVGLRLPALIFGLGNIVLLYLLGRRCLGRNAAFLAAMALALSPMHLYFSANARGYTLLALGGLVQAYAGLRLLECETRWRWSAFILGAVVAGYAHLYGIVLAGFIGLSVLIAAWTLPVGRWERRQLSGRLVWAGGFMLTTLFLLYATGIPRQLEIADYLGNTLSYYAFRPRMGVAFLGNLASEFSLAPQWPAAVVVQWLLAGAGIAVVLRRQAHAGLVLFLPALGFFVAMAVAGKEVQTRYFFASMPVFCFFSAAGLWWALHAVTPARFRGAGRRSAAGLIVALIGALLLSAWAAAGVRDLLTTELHGLRAAVALVRQTRQPGERVVALTDSAQTAHYYWDAVEPAERPAELARIRSNPPTWILYAGEPYIKVDAPDLYRMLETRYQRVFTVPARYPVEGTAHVWRRQ